MVHCSNCGKKASKKSGFCGNCGNKLTPANEQTTHQKIGTKNPWIAAILNFLLPGLGFVYIGRLPYVVGGVLLIFVGIVATLIAIDSLDDPAGLLVGIMWGFVWGLAGYFAAAYENKKFS